MLSISSAFDSGNILVDSLEDPLDIQLRICADNQSHFYQWFHYRLQGAAGQACRMRILNAAGAAYPGGWEGYQAVASYDRHDWFRVPTVYVDGELVIEHTPEQDIAYYAYFTPYSWEQHQNLVAWAAGSDRCRCEALGETLDGRPLDLLQIGTPGAGKRNIWVIARQHPGETMGGWLMEGLLERLLDDQDPLANALLADAVFHVVPNINPDGAVRGHLRTNALGVNLNREWAAPSLERSPEVFRVRQRMDATGVDLFLDVHGDETIPFNFLAGCAGNPGFSDRQQQLEAAFSQAFLAASPDFQVDDGYSADQFGAETPTIASNWVGERFDCLALTLEMPFKDNAGRPLPAVGWSAERSHKLGQSILQPMLAVLGQLR